MIYPKHTNEMPDQVNKSELAVMALQISVMQNGQMEMKAALRELTSAVTKLALVELRQDQFTKFQDRTLAMIEKLETRLTALELSERQSRQSINWVNNAVWATVVAVGIFVGKKVGLI